MPCISCSSSFSSSFSSSSSFSTVTCSCGVPRSWLLYAARTPPEASPAHDLLWPCLCSPTARSSLLYNVYAEGATWLHCHFFNTCTVPSFPYEGMDDSCLLTVRSYLILSHQVPLHYCCFPRRFSFSYAYYIWFWRQLNFRWSNI